MIDNCNQTALLLAIAPSNSDMKKDGSIIKSMSMPVTTLGKHQNTLQLTMVISLLSKPV